MTLPPDFAIVAALRQPILPRELHFLAILRFLGTFALPSLPTTAELGTHLGQTYPQNFCSPSIEGLTKFGG